jgi:hypothetical protein
MAAIFRSRAAGTSSRSPSSSTACVVSSRAPVAWRRQGRGAVGRASDHQGRDESGADSGLESERHLAHGHSPPRQTWLR